MKGHKFIRCSKCEGNKCNLTDGKTFVRGSGFGGNIEDALDPAKKKKVSNYHLKTTGFHTLRTKDFEFHSSYDFRETSRTQHGTTNSGKRLSSHELAKLRRRSRAPFASFDHRNPKNSQLKINHLIYATLAALERQKRAQRSGGLDGWKLAGGTVLDFFPANSRGMRRHRNAVPDH